MNEAQSSKWKYLFEIEVVIVPHILGLRTLGDGEHFTVGCRGSDVRGTAEKESI